MADETKENNTPESKTFTQEEVERMMKGRGKKMEQEIADLQSQNEALNSQISNIPPPQPTQQPAVPDASAVTGAVPAQADGQGSPLTAESVQQMLAEHGKIQQNEAQAAQAHNYAHGQIKNLMDDDQDFSDLINKDTDNQIPGAAWISIMNRFNPKVAKGVLKKLLTNPYEFAIMKNHFLEGKFENWLSQRMNSNSQEQSQGMPSPPDLSGDSIKGDNLPQYESAIDNYMKNVR